MAKLFGGVFPDILGGLCSDTDAVGSQSVAQPQGMGARWEDLGEGAFAFF